MRFFSRLIDAFAEANGPPPRQLVPFFKWSLKGAWPIIWLSLLASVLVGFGEVLSAYFIGWAIDLAMEHGPAGLFTAHWEKFAALAAFFVILRPIVMGINGGLSSLSLGVNLFPLVMARLHRHTLGQSLSFFDDDFAGRIAQKQQQTARAIGDLVMESMNVGGFAIASAIGATAFVTSIHPALGGVVLVWLIAYLLLIRWYLPRIRRRSKERAAQRAIVTGQVVDTITNMPTVKLFAHGEHEDRAALDALTSFRKTAADFGELSVWFRYTLMSLAGTLPVALIGGALWLWSRGLATPGDIAAASLIATRLGQMSGWVSFTALGMFSNIGEIEDGMKTLAHDHTIVDRADAIELGRVEGKIDFQNVSFGYGREEAALDSFNLVVQPGEKVGLVGRSGAGKTTAVSLLLRLYDVEAGSVMIDGVDIREIAQDSLRRQIGMVTQDTAMFNRSAKDNIGYGRPDSDDKAVEAAARQAEAHEFIKDLRDAKDRQGYDVYLGERGVKLSGGQRQRIALARAFLKDAPILVLDEATSALDSEVEAVIQEKLEELMQGKTVIAIAHRLSTISRMDRIIVMDGGKIVEEGNHESLLNKQGLYAGFWNRQSGGFLGTDPE
ncbi:MAG: ABC transporter ATP-binding protein [Verrucomicrobiales bacterium]|nr:ABC transporter ATP-binding protein [Verrucomicrobiales bacterium]